jgi:hypothetical protein
MSESREVSAARAQLQEDLTEAQAAFVVWRETAAREIGDWITTQTRAHVVNEPEISNALGKERIQALRASSEALAAEQIKSATIRANSVTPELLIDTPSSQGGIGTEVRTPTSSAHAEARKALAKLLAQFGYPEGRWASWDWYENDSKETIEKGITIPNATSRAETSYTSAAKKAFNSTQTVAAAIHHDERKAAESLWEQ